MQVRKKDAANRRDHSLVGRSITPSGTRQYGVRHARRGMFCPVAGSHLQIILSRSAQFNRADESESNTRRSYNIAIGASRTKIGHIHGKVAGCMAVSGRKASVCGMWYVVYQSRTSKSPAEEIAMFSVVYALSLWFCMYLHCRVESRHAQRSMHRHKRSRRPWGWLAGL